MKAHELDPELWDEIATMDIVQRLNTAKVFRRWANQLDEFIKSDVHLPTPERCSRN